MRGVSIRFGWPAGLGRLAGDRRGSMLIEAAVVLPILATFILGGIETTRFILLHQKMALTAASIADLATRDDALSRADVEGLLLAAQQVLRPFPVGEDSVVIISSVTGRATPPARLNWQHRGAGTLEAAGTVRRADGYADLPSGLVLPAGETAIVAEVYYRYTPAVLESLTSGEAQHHAAVFRPRRGEPTTLQ